MRGVPLGPPLKLCALSSSMFDFPVLLGHDFAYPLADLLPNAFSNAFVPRTHDQNVVHRVFSPHHPHAYAVVLERSLQRYHLALEPLRIPHPDHRSRELGEQALSRWQADVRIARWGANVRAPGIAIDGAVIRLDALVVVIARVFVWAQRLEIDHALSRSVEHREHPLARG